jgi:hypothetical protein
VGIHPSDNRLANEVNILRKLGCCKDRIDGTALPVLIEDMELTFQLGGVPQTGQGLVLSPKGRVIEGVFKSIEKRRVSGLYNTNSC